MKIFLRLLSNRRPKVTNKTKRALRVSRRWENQREVVRNRNQASVYQKTLRLDYQTVVQRSCKVRLIVKQTVVYLSGGPDRYQTYSGTFLLLQRL